MRLPFGPPPPPPRDPRSTPVPGDRLLLRTEGAERIVVTADLYNVVWRFAGGSITRTSRQGEWFEEMQPATVVARGD